MASRIQFGKIYYHNFMSFADQEWDFSQGGHIFLISGKNHDLRVDDSGVCASNGSGKTNLVQGLMYALYGQFPYKIHNANILNKYSKEKDSEGYVMKVTLEFSITDGNKEANYKIIRGSTEKNASSGMRLLLFSKTPDGKWEDISKASSALTQQYIETLLRLNFQSFQRLVMLSFDPAFNFFRMTASQKRDFIQALFDTEVYSKIWENVKKDLSRFSMALQGDKVRLNTLQSQLVNCEEEIRAYAKSMKDQVEETDKKLGEIEDQLKAIQLNIVKAEEEKKLAAKTKEDHSATVNKVSDAIRQLEYKLHSLQQSEGNAQRYIEKCQKEISKHRDILEMVCEDCRGKIRSAYNLSEYEAEIAISKEALQKTEEGIKKITEALDKGHKKMLELGDAGIKIDRSLQDVDSKIYALGMDEQRAKVCIETLKSNRQTLMESSSDPKKIPMMGSYVNLKKGIQECEKDIKKGENELECLTLCEQVVSPEAVRRNIVSRVVKSINELVNRNLDELNTTIRCEFDDQLDKFTILAPQNWNIDYQNLSKGEQMKLLFATQLAFRKFLLLRLNLSFNCFVLDEIVDQNFDTLSISRILDVLMDMASADNVSIYIISHRGEVGRLVDDLLEYKPDLRSSVSRILVEKKNNISTLTPA